MRNTMKRVLIALILGVVTYVIGVALLFLNYNWEIFTQFVKNCNVEVGITLIIPALVAGWVLRSLWPRKNKKS